MLKRALAVALLIGAAAGCANPFRAVIPAQAGKVWVVRFANMGSTLWNCEAPGGQPTCYQVKNAGGAQ